MQIRGVFSDSAAFSVSKKGIVREIISQALGRWSETKMEHGRAASLFNTRALVLNTSAIKAKAFIRPVRKDLHDYTVTHITRIQ